MKAQYLNQRDEKNLYDLFVWTTDYRNSDKQDIKQVFDILFVITTLKNKIQWHKMIEKILRMKYFVSTIILNESGQESLKR